MPTYDKDIVAFSPFGKTPDSSRPSVTNLSSRRIHRMTTPVDVVATQYYQTEKRSDGRNLFQL